MTTVARAARHVGTTAGPAEEVLQVRVYRNRDDRSTSNLFEQAADVLALLSLLPLTAQERVGFWALFERRLHRWVDAGRTMVFKGGDNAPY